MNKILPPVQVIKAWVTCYACVTLARFDEMKPEILNDAFGQVITL